MAYAVRTQEVRDALAPMLGRRLTEQTALCDHAAETMRRYLPGRMTLEEMTRQVRDAIFGDLFELLGHRMLLQLDNGVVLRIRLEDVDLLADAAMGVLLDVLPPAVLPLDALREHAMCSGSLSAMRVLLQRWERLLPPGEGDMLRRIIRENYPREMYESWLGNA